MHDPQVYEDPDVYRPERFLKDGQLNPTVRDPFNYAFGYGRRSVQRPCVRFPPLSRSSSVHRICPGRHFAEASLFINIASVLHVFNISPPVDEHERLIHIEPRMSENMLT